MREVQTESDLVNFFLFPFKILPSHFEVLGFIECGLGVRSQSVQSILEGKVVL